MIVFIVILMIMKIETLQINQALRSIGKTITSQIRQKQFLLRVIIILNFLIAVRNP